MYGTPSRHMHSYNNHHHNNNNHNASTPLSAASRTSFSRRGTNEAAVMKSSNVPPVVADFFAVIEDTPVDEWQKRSAALRKVVDSIPEFQEQFKSSSSNSEDQPPAFTNHQQHPDDNSDNHNHWYTSPAALRHLAIPIAELLKDPRSTVVKRTCESLARLFHKCHAQARYLVRDLMPTILSVHAQTVQVIRQAVQAMVSDAAIPNVPCKMVMPLWMERLKVDKSRTVRDACALYLGQALHHWDTPDGYLTAEIWLQVGATLIRTLRDPSTQVRSHAKLALEHMQERHDDYWERLLHDPEGPASKDRKVYRWLLSLGSTTTPDGNGTGTGGMDAEELSVASKFSYNSDSRYAARTVPSAVLARSTTPSKRSGGGAGGSHHSRSASLGGGGGGNSAAAAFTRQEDDDLFGVTPPPSSSSVPLSISYHPPPPPSSSSSTNTATSTFLKRRMAGRSSSNPRAAREEATTITPARSTITTTATATETTSVKPNLRITVPTTTTDAVGFESSSAAAANPSLPPPASTPSPSPESPPPKKMGAGPPPALPTPERVETGQGGGGTTTSTTTTTTSPSTPKYLNTIQDQEEDEGDDEPEVQDGDNENGIPDELESNPSFPTDLNHAFGKTSSTTTTITANGGNSSQSTQKKVPKAVAAGGTTPVEASSLSTLSNKPETHNKKEQPSKFHFQHADDEAMMINDKPPSSASLTETPTEHEPNRTTTTEHDDVHYVTPSLSASRSEDTTTEKNGGDGGGPFIQSMQQLKQHASKRRSRNSILMQERFRMSGSLLDDAGGSEDNYDQSESAVGDVMMKYSEEENEVPKGEDKNNTTNAKLSSPRHLQDNNTNIYQQHLPSQQPQQGHSYHSTEAAKSPTLTASSSAPEHMIIAIRLLRAHKAHVDQIMETLKIEMDTLRDFDRLLEEPGRPVEDEVLDYFEGVGLCLDQRTQAGEALQREMDRISRGEPPQES